MRASGELVAQKQAPEPLRLPPAGMRSVVFLAVVATAIAAAAEPPSSGWRLEVDLTVEHVFFNKSADSCFEWDVIDETLNAFRDGDGLVRMVAGNGNVGQHGRGPASR